MLLVLPLNLYWVTSPVRVMSVNLFYRLPARFWNSFSTTFSLPLFPAFFPPHLLPPFPSFLPYLLSPSSMSRWRRSVDELAARRRQQWECERAQEALSRVTSCFQQLAASLGSSADGGSLRDEMNETRTLAHRICTGMKHPYVSRLVSGCSRSFLQWR